MRFGAIVPLFCAMKVLLSVLALMGVVVAGVTLVWHERSTRQLRQEVAGLREEVKELAAHEKARGTAARGVAQADTVQAMQHESDRSEVAQLREDLEALKKRAQEFGRVVQAGPAAARPADAIPTQLTPMSAWKNSGRDTPNSAIETVLWAASGGEVDALAGSITFTASAREKAEALLAGLPEAARRQYGSPEKLIALMISKDASKVTGMQVLGQREVGANDVGMRVRFGNEQGQTKDDTFVFHRAADGYRLLLNDAPVEKFARQIRGEK